MGCPRLDAGSAGRAAGLQQHISSNVENGLKDVKLTTLIALAVALNLDVSLTPRQPPAPDDIRDIFLMGRRPAARDLRVLVNGRSAGLYRRAASGAISFSYDAGWLTDIGIRLSLSLSREKARRAGRP